MQNDEDDEPDRYWCHDSFKLKFSSSSDMLKVKISTLIASYFVAEQAHSGLMVNHIVITLSDFIINNFIWDISL